MNTVTPATIGAAKRAWLSRVLFTAGLVIAMAILGLVLNNSVHRSNLCR